MQAHTSQLKAPSLVLALLNCRRLEINKNQALWHALNIAAGEMAAKFDVKALSIVLNVTSVVGVYNKAVVERLCAEVVRKARGERQATSIRSVWATR